MIRVPLDAEGVARIRFAVSPLAELSVLLALVARTPQHGPARRWAALAQDIIGQHRLDLLAALAAPSYFPDFLTPALDGEERSVHDELHLVHGTSEERVAGEVDVVARGRPVARLPGRPLSRVLVQTLDKGIPVFLDRLCEQLYVLWRQSLSPRWSQLRRPMEAAISAAAVNQIRDGSGVMLNNLNPGLRWAESTLLLRSRYAGNVVWAHGVQLAPSVLAQQLFSVIDVDPLGYGLVKRRDPLFIFPVSQARSSPAIPSEKRYKDLEDLLGPTRARLLADLRVGRRTTDLAARHHLAPSGVSYHLGILTRAGVITRRRARNGVFYEASPLGLQLLPDDR